MVAIFVWYVFVKRLCSDTTSGTVAMDKNEGPGMPGDIVPITRPASASPAILEALQLGSGLAMSDEEQETLRELRATLHSVQSA